MDGAESDQEVGTPLRGDAESTSSRRGGRWRQIGPENLWSRPTVRQPRQRHTRWRRVKERLRAEVGEDVFQSWFTRMELEGIDDITARLSVPTRFLKSWIQSHYVDRLLGCWQQENSNVTRIELSVGLIHASRA